MIDSLRAATHARRSTKDWAAGKSHGGAVLAIGLVAIGYLIGSIPLAYLAARWRGHDLLAEGPGGVSGSAAIERLGVVPGALAGLADALKPALAILIAQRLGSYELSAAAGIAAVVGHIWPVTLRFRGGRGVGPAGAALAALGVWQMALAFAGLVLGRYLIRDSAPGALLGFFATAVTMSLTGASIIGSLAAWILFGVLVTGRVLGFRKESTSGDSNLLALLVRRVLLDRDRR